MQHRYDEADIEAGLDNDMSFSLSSDDENTSVHSDTSVETCDTSLQCFSLPSALQICYGAPQMAWDLMTLLLNFLVHTRGCCVI